MKDINRIKVVLVEKKRTSKLMHCEEFRTIAKLLPLLRQETYNSLIFSYSADFGRIF